MATTKRMSKASNIVMVALAAIIVIAGIAFVMSVRGGQDKPSPFTVSRVIGYANIERAGINYALEEGAALQHGDVIETLDGSQIALASGSEAQVFLADASKMQVSASDGTDADADLELISGLVFADSRMSDKPVSFQGQGLKWHADNAVYVSDVRKGALTVQVLAGQVSFLDGIAVHEGESRVVLSAKAEAGAQAPQASGSQAGSPDGQESSLQGSSAVNPAVNESPSGSSSSSNFAANEVTKLTLGSLDSFALQHALDIMASGRTLVFTEEQVNAELQRREDEKRQIADEASGNDAANTEQGSTESSTSADESLNAAEREETSQATETETSANDGQPASEDVQQGAADAAEESGETQESAPDKPAAAPAEDPKPAKLTCTLQIHCKTILRNMDDLAKGKSKYVPSDGFILRSTKVAFEEGETAFDVLKRVCDQEGIALEYSYAPVYGSYYVEGIGNLYEFDCGDESGWMYKVNGWFPNYGCSEYALTDGDAVVFCYTCKGIGEDVGA